MLLLLGQLLHWLDVVPADLLLSLKYAMRWVPLSLPDVTALCYFTGVLLTVGHIYFLCNGNSDKICTSSLSFFVYFFLVADDGGVAWVGVEGF